MKVFYLLILLTCYLEAGLTQNLIQGKVLDKKGNPLVGANVFIKNTFWGTSTDTLGLFKFQVKDKLQDTLVVRLMGYEEIAQKIQLTDTTQLLFKLKEEANELNTVVITAGTFEASDEKKMVVLKPLDIVRTASSNGDLFGALQTLPGAQRVGEQEGLFVRGGSANESKTLIDGMLVQNPFFSSLPDVSTRSRFSPFLFKGTAFSTGGYSAQYGQALSSVLNLQSQDLPEESNLNLFASPITGGITGTKRWDNTSLALSANYTNVAFTNWLIPQNIDWIRPFSGWGASAIFRHRFKENDLLKSFSNYGYSDVGLHFRDFGGSRNAFGLRNQNIFQQLHYEKYYQKWTLEAGLSYSYNADLIDLNEDNVRQIDDRIQTRLVAKRDILKNSSLLLGAEWHQYHFEQSFNAFGNQLNETYTAFFAETEIYLTRKLAGRIGARAEHSAVLGRFNLASRFSFAYKTGKFSQVSMAFGEFYQNPETRYLYQNTDLNFEKSLHYILNYQWMKEGYTFRVEAFSKDYQDLVRELDNQAFNPDPNRRISAQLDNSGSGFARGIDLFWRDNGKSLKNIDYWISYSFIDTERLYQNFPRQASPVFASKHNLNVVYKHFIAKWSLDFNLTYSYASGRPYYNPNAAQFMSDLTPDFHNVALGLNYLTTFLQAQTIVIFSINNVFNRENVFGYRYSADGSERIAVNPPVFRSFFIGVSMTFE